MSHQATACDGSGFTIDGLVDNGDGTYSITVTVIIAGVDWGGGTFGGTQGFFFGVDVPIVSITPGSFTSANGTTFPAVISGNMVNWGTVGAGPYFVDVTDNTQAFTFTIVVSGRPMSWNGGGQEEANCSYSDVFPCPLPSVAILEGDQFICEGQPVMLTADVIGATSFFWSTGATTPVITDLPTETTTYELFAINDCGQVSTSVTVYVNPLPQMFGSFDVTEICQGDSIVLEVYPEFVNDIIWAPVPGNTPFLQVSPDISTVYTALGTNDCGVVEVYFTVNVNQFPIAVPVNPAPVICPGEFVTLEAFVDHEDFLNWLPGGGSGNTLRVNPSADSTFVLYADNFCGTDSAIFNVTVDDLPEIVPLNNLSTCAGQSVSIIPFTSNVDVYNWSPGGSTDSVLIVAPLTTTTYTLIASNDCGEDTIDVTVTIADDIQLDLPLQACQGGTVRYNGEDLAAGSRRPFTFTSSGGCDSIVTVIVEELPTFTNSVTLQACDGATVDYNGNDLSPNTIQDFTFASLRNGCDSVVTVTVDESTTVLDAITLEACEDGNILYNGTSLLPNTTQDFTFVALSNGCDSIVTVTVDEIPTITNAITLEACENGTVAYNGTDLSPNTTMDFTFTALSNNCDSVVTVNVDEIATITNAITLQACENGTVAYDGVDLAPNTSRDFTFTALSNNCDSIVTVNVDEVATVTNSLTLEACPGGNIHYDGTLLLPNTTTDFTFTSMLSNCDSVVTVNVVESAPITNSITLQACENGTVAYDGVDLAPNITRDFTFTALSNNCDSVVTVTVDEVATITNAVTLQACENGTVAYNGVDLAPNTTRDFTFTALSNNCDSIVTVSVDEVATITNAITLQACQGGTIAYNGVDLAPNTTRDFTFTALSNNCDSIVTVSVDEVAIITNAITLQACQGGTIAYNGIDLAPNTTRDFTFTALSNNCDSVVTVSVDEIPVITNAITLQACQGGTVAYNGAALAPNTTRDFTFTALSNNCDSIVTVSVDEIPVITNAITLQACQGGTVAYNGTDLAPNTTRDFTFTALSNNCDSIVTVSVDEVAVITNAITLEACENGTVAYNGVDLSPNTSRDFTFTALSSNCDSVVTVSVDEIPTITNAISLEACRGGTVAYDGVDLAPNTSRDFTFTALSNNCDSIVTVSVDEIPVITNAITLEACQGGTVDYDGVALAPNTTRDFTFTALSNNCDSVVTVTVDQVAALTESLLLEACIGGTVDYDGVALAPNTTRDFTFSTSDGCDSIVTVTVEEIATITGDLELETCTGTTVSYNGSDLAPNTSTDFTFTALSNGCDSIVTVSVREVSVITESLGLETCMGTTIDYNGTALSPNTTQDFTFTSGNGCDSIVTVTVDELEVFSDNLELEACTGTTVAYNGMDLDPNTSMDFTFTADNGCDSVITVDVVELEVFADNLELEACTGTTVAYNGMDLAPNTTMDFTFPASNGCDSVVTVFVEELSNSTEAIVLETCTGSTIDYNGTALSPNTTRDFTFVAPNGCDSVVTVTVNEVSAITTDLDLETCTGTTIRYNGTDLAPNTVRDFTFTSMRGCDSIVTVTVNEVAILTEDLDLEACTGTTVAYNGTDLAPNTTRDFTFTSSNGCDSVVTVTVAELPILTDNVDLEACTGTTVAYDGIDLAPNSSRDFTFTAQSGCDSIVTVTVAELPILTDNVDLEACTGTTVAYDGIDLAPNSSRDFTFTAQSGCDSIVTVTVAELPIVRGDLDLETCTGTTISYNGMDLAPNTTMDFTFTAQSGCDSIVTVRVAELPILSDDLELQTCTGTTIEYNGVDLDPNTTMDFTFTSSQGCDSIVTVTVNEVPIIREDLMLQTCVGTTVAYNGTQLSANSSTDFTFLASNGCDSIVTVMVEELPNSSGTLQLQTCEGVPVMYQGVELDPFSVTDFTLVASNGCDSLLTVFVSDVAALSATEEDITICAGDSIAAFGDVYSGSGSYSATFTGSNGCDSTHTIMLEVLPAISSTLESTNTCKDEAGGTALANVSGGLQPYTYGWSNGMNTASVEQLVAGNYILTITDAFGCTDIQSTEVETFNIAVAPEPADVSCFGYTDGSLIIPNGGNGWTYSLDGIIFSDAAAFNNLPASNYTLFIKDENACVYEENFSIDQPALLIVNLLEDTLIGLGKGINLNSNTNAGIPIYFWEDNPDLECNDCPNPFVSPIQTTNYKLTVTDDKGCTAEDDVTITVKNDFNVYIPNIFTPDGNNINDLFQIFSDESVLNVKEMSIFSRWGEQLYLAKDFLPNDPTIGWDGTFKGKELDPAVYVYYAIIEFKDGTEKLFKGDVTLVR